jgi:predicted HTH domain antitoxin
MKKEELVAARLPEALISDIKRIEAVEQADRSTVLRKLLVKAIREWKMEYAARQYAENKLTLERAAMDANVSVREMMEYLKQKKIPLQYDLEDLEEDMKAFYRRLGKP